MQPPFYKLTIIGFCFILFGCPKKEDNPAPLDTRTQITREGINVQIARAGQVNSLPELPKCGGTVSYSNLKFSHKAATSEEAPGQAGCKWDMKRTGSGYVYVPEGSAFIVDFSYYSNIDVISFNFSHACSGSPSPVVAFFFYDFDGKLIHKREISGLEDRYQTIYFKEEFSKLKEVKFVNLCEGLIADVSARNDD